VDNEYKTHFELRFWELSGAFGEWGGGRRLRGLEYKRDEGKLCEWRWV
jgi:hypothetical protein